MSAYRRLGVSEASRFCFQRRSRRSPFTVHRSPFTVHRSPFTVHRSSFAVHRSPFTVHRSPFTVHRSPFTVWRSPFTVWRSPTRRHAHTRFPPFIVLRLSCYRRHAHTPTRRHGHTPIRVSRPATTIAVMQRVPTITDPSICSPRIQ
jgi:hypothetical protein